jgi:hypothetical protein
MENSSKAINLQKDLHQDLKRGDALSHASTMLNWFLGNPV